MKKKRMQQQESPPASFIFCRILWFGMHLSLVGSTRLRLFCSLQQQRKKFYYFPPLQ